MSFRLARVNGFLRWLGLCVVIQVWDGVGEWEATRILLMRHRAWRDRSDAEGGDLVIEIPGHSSILVVPSSSDTSAAGR